MNYKSILFFLGIFSLLISFFSFLNIIYSIYFNFSLDLNSYVVTLIISLFLGSIFSFIGRKHHKDISLNTQLGFIVISFIYVPLLISLPYFLSIYNLSFLNSYFESVSGITGTGFSIFENIKNIDEPLLLWRSSSQWLGGLLFLVSVIGTIGSRQIKIKPIHLVYGGTLGRNFYNDFNYNFIKILLIYFFSTILIIFLYKLVNIRFFDGLNLAFTTISSGGFLSKNFLSEIVKNDIQIFILSITLLFPVLNFYLLFNIATNNFTLKNHQEDQHLIILILLVILFLYFFIIPDEGLTNTLLAVTSSISTSGISIHTQNYDFSLFFILLTIIGGSLISTSSGFKYVRIYILLKTSYQEMYKLVKPLNVTDNNLFNTDVKIDDADTKVAFLIFISFIISVFLLSSILSFENLDFDSYFTLALLTLTNTTNSTLFGTENLNFFYFNNISKISLIIFMILGKIEVIAILFLLKKVIFKE